MDEEKTKLLHAAERYLQRGKVRRAISVYRKVLRLDPQDLRAKLKLGDLYARTGDVSSSVPIFRAVAEHYAAQGQFLKATAVYKRLVELDASNPSWALQLAESYQSQGLRNDAADQYRVAIELFAAAGDGASMLATVKRLLALDPNNVVGRVRLAEAFSRGGWIDEASEQYRALCQLLRRQGRRDDFARCAERLLYHDPDDFEVARELASYYVDQDFPQRALPKLRRCYRLKPRDVDVLELLAVAFDQLNQSHKAVVVLKALAAIYEQSGLQREYREIMSRILEMEPDDAEARSVFSAPVASVSEEIVFDAGELPRTERPAASGDDDERGFDELEELMAEVVAEPSLAGAPLPPQELSLSGVTMEDITADAVAAGVTAIPIVSAEADDAEELPFDSDADADVDVDVDADVDLSPSEVITSAPPTPRRGGAPATEAAGPDSPEGHDRGAEPAATAPPLPAPEGAPFAPDDEWYDENDRTLVDHHLTPEESTLVDHHVRLAGFDPAGDREALEILRPGGPLRGAPSSDAPAAPAAATPAVATPDDAAPPAPEPEAAPPPAAPSEPGAAEAIPDARPEDGPHGEPAAPERGAGRVTRVIALGADPIEP